MDTPKKPRLDPVARQCFRSIVNTGEIQLSESSTQTEAYSQRPRYKGQDPWPKIAQLKCHFKNAKENLQKQTEHTEDLINRVRCLQRELATANIKNRNLGIIQ